MKLLLVEDDDKLAATMQRGLEDADFIVDRERDGLMAVTATENCSYDLVILDLMLPFMGGMEFLRRFRGAGRTTPIVVVSAMDAVRHRVKGLQSGADDYLVKPFEFAELLARVRSILRRGPIRDTANMRIADVLIDVSGHRVTRAGQDIRLTAKEFQLLILLTKRPGEVFSRTTIIEQVWDMNFQSEANPIEVTVRRLRSKLDDPFTRKLIRTVRGVGYVIDPH